jgi:hypothetical protein
MVNVYDLFTFDAHEVVVLFSPVIISSDIMEVTDLGNEIVRCKDFQVFVNRGQGNGGMFLANFSVNILDCWVVLTGLHGPEDGYSLIRGIQSPLLAFLNEIMDAIFCHF